MSEYEEGIIILPDAEEMLKRLVAVDDQPHFQERFYPILLRYAGTEKVAGGVVMMLTMAIYDYTQGMPPLVAFLMHREVPQWIDALVTDPKVAEAAKAFHAEVTKPTKQGETG